MTKFAHDFAEEVMIVFFESGLKNDQWVSEQAYHLMFKENEMSQKSIKEDVFGDY